MDPVSGTFSPVLGLAYFLLAFKSWINYPFHRDLGRIAREYPASSSTVLNIAK